jgi:hypothetical protein
MTVTKMNLDEWPIDNYELGVTHHEVIGEIVEIEDIYVSLAHYCSCGATLLTVSELIWTTDKQEWRKKLICSDRKTTGCQ